MTVKNAVHDTRGYFRRNATPIALTIIALCIILIFTLQAMTIGSLKNTVNAQNETLATTKRIAEQIAESGKASQEQVNDINRHLDCIVRFFSEPNRTQKSIDDIEQCRISAAQPLPAQTQPSQPNSQPIAQTPAGNQPSQPPQSPSEPTEPDCVVSILGLELFCN